MWKIYLERPQNPEGANEIIFNEMVPVLNRMTWNRFSNHELYGWYREKLCPFNEGALDYLTSASSFKDFIQNRLLVIFDEDELSYLKGYMFSTWRRWETRIISLSPSLIASIKDVYQEYLLWLKKHSDVVDKIAWEAFEKIIAEIFASRGFHIELTGRLRNRSSDILAVRVDEFGVQTKYLIECKRYRSTRRVGMDIVNGVIGSARRADVDHAFLVTSSFFTKDVDDRQSEFEQLRLHLRDGDDVRQWLKDYKARSDYGLWLASGWDTSI